MSYEAIYRVPFFQNTPPYEQVEMGFTNFFVFARIFTCKV